MFSNPQFPPGVAQNFIQLDAGMHRRKISFSIVCKTQDSFGSYHRRWTATRQAHTLPPALSVSVTWTCEIRNSLGQTLAAVLEQHDEALRQRRDVARSA